MEKILEKVKKKTLIPVAITFAVLMGIGVILLVLGLILGLPVYYGFAGIAAFFGLLFLLLGLPEYLKSRKRLSAVSADDWIEIEKEMQNPKYEFKDKINEFYITENYVISFGKGFEIIAVKDIVWVYDLMISQNGINTQRHVLVWTEDRKKHMVAYFVPMGADHEIRVREILGELGAGSDRIMVGYAKENVIAARDVYGIRA